MSALLVAVQYGLKRVALLLEVTPWLRACFVASHTFGIRVPASSMAFLDLLHGSLDKAMKVRTMIAVVLLVVVAPPVLLALTILAC